MRKSRVPTTSIACQFDLSWVSVVVVQVSGHFGLRYKSRWLVYIPITRLCSDVWVRVCVCYLHLGTLKLQYVALLEICESRSLYV